MEQKLLQFSQISIDDFMGMIDEKFNQSMKKLTGGLTTEKDSTTPLTRTDTAKMLKVSLTTLHNWAKQGVLIPKKIGKRVYYDRKEVLSKLEIET